MNRVVVVVVVAVGAFFVGCGAGLTPDGGSEGGGAGGGGGGGGGGGATALDAGWGGTLFGAAAVPVNSVSASSRSPDGGFEVGALHVYFHDRPAGTNVCANIGAAGSFVEVSLGTGSSAISPGTYTLGVTAAVTRYDVDDAGTAAVRGYGFVGTVTIMRLDGARSTGSFSTTIDLIDGGPAGLTGSWDTVNCQ